jgi:hypothetical protein
MPREARAAYIGPPPAIANPTPAGVRGWFAGWPDDCPAFTARTLVAISRPSDGHVFRLSVDTRLAELFGDFISLAQADGRYELRTAVELSDNGRAQGGNGSFMCRAIKGSNPPAPSNHSSATAIDLWTRANAQTRNGTFVSTIHPEVVELAAAALIYWGGWYFDAAGTYVDAMHFEFMATPADVDGARIALADKAEEIRRRKEPPPPPEEAAPTRNPR